MNDSALRDFPYCTQFAMVLPSYFVNNVYNYVGIKSSTITTLLRFFVNLVRTLSFLFICLIPNIVDATFQFTNKFLFTYFGREYTNRASFVP